MTDLRQAAQQALEAWDDPMGMKDLCVAMDAIRTALEQQAEPVAETYIHAYRNQPHPNDFGIPKGHWWKAKQYADALYTTPPQRPWVGLTDEELDGIAVVARRGNLHDLRIAIETKLKEKNSD